MQEPWPHRNSLPIAAAQFRPFSFQALQIMLLMVELTSVLTSLVQQTGSETTVIQRITSNAQAQLMKITGSVS
jgi:hypothetical protein